MRTLIFVFAVALQGQQAGKPLEFEVATVKPADPNERGQMVNMLPGGGLKVTNMTLKRLMMMAYNVRESQLIGLTGWMDTAGFDIQAKAERTEGPVQTGPLTDAQRQERRRQTEERLRSLLMDRFQLVVKKEDRVLPVYSLVVAKGGLKLQAAKEEQGGRQGISMQRGMLSVTAADMETLSNVLAQQVGRPVIDKTGLKGRYDGKLEWTPDAPATEEKSTELLGPSIFSALQETFGLKLEAQKASVAVLVVERAEKPSAN